MNRQRVAMRIGALALTVLGLALMARAQSGLPLPGPVEKELAARAKEVTEVTLDKNMLGFAAKFMNDKDENQANVRRLISGLEGVYVREYEFDKEGQYSMEDVAKLRSNFASPEWSTMVREHERNSGETTEILVKLVNGEPHGMFILAAEPKELTIVLILGPIHAEDLSKLSGLAGLDSLGDIDGGHHSQKLEKDKDKTKDKPADKKGDDE